MVLFAWLRSDATRSGFSSYCFRLRRFGSAFEERLVSLGGDSRDGSEGMLSSSEEQDSSEDRTGTEVVSGDEFSEHECGLSKNFTAS